MRLRLFLGMWAVIALVIGVTVVVAQRLDGGDAGDQVVSDGDGTVLPGAGAGTSLPPDDPSFVPAPGQMHVTGKIAAAHLEGAVLEPRELLVPLTVVSDRGFGNGGQLTGVTVDGVASTIVWDGGRPFQITSGGSLVLDPADVDLVPEGVRVVLGGGVHNLTVGPYQVDAPVAVGSQGLATPRDRVVFEATAGAAFEARGDASIVLGPEQPRRLVGPGLVHLEGELEVVDDAGRRAAAVVDLPSGPFEVTLTPDPAGGWTIDAVLQGEPTAS